MSKVFILYFILHCLSNSYQLRLNKKDVSRTTMKTIIVETTTQFIEIVTDIPQSDVEEAMHMDVGVYTTMVFPYFNSQFDKLQEIDKCHDDYTKCLLTQTVPHPVCAVNDHRHRPRGYITYNSYCDLYFDNCERQMRFWRILDIGKCKFTPTNADIRYIFDIEKSRKFQNLPVLFKKILKTLIEDAEYKDIQTSLKNKVESNKS